MSLIGFISEFFFSKTGCYSKLKKNQSVVQFTYIQWKNRRIHFQRLLALCETHIASSRIWTLVTVSIFYDNHYTKCGSWKLGCTLELLNLLHQHFKPIWLAFSFNIWNIGFYCYWHCEVWGWVQQSNQTQYCMCTFKCVCVCVCLCVCVCVFLCIRTQARVVLREMYMMSTYGYI